MSLGYVRRRARVLVNIKLCLGLELVMLSFMLEIGKRLVLEILLGFSLCSVILSSMPKDVFLSGV